MNKKIHDLIGIGVGPFNLSLAVLTEETAEVDAMYFEQEMEFNWHPGMLIEGMDMQTPFLADLVTFANPTSPHTFLNYLHVHNRLYQFYFFNRFTIPREQYNDYCQWVVSNLNHCYFGMRVVDVIDHTEESSPHYEVIVENLVDQTTTSYFSRHIVLGTGSIPNIPKPLQGFPNEDVTHTSRYLYLEDSIKNSKSITVVGSGQSASEVFYDLLKDQKKHGYDLTWFTRSGGFFQKDETSLGKEVFSPEFIDYFHKLSFEGRQESLKTLDSVRNGVDPVMLNKIYEIMYNRSIHADNPSVTIQSSTSVKDINKDTSQSTYQLTCEQWLKQEEFTHSSDKVILATGYKPNLPDWLQRFSEQIIWEDKHLYKVTKDYRLAFKKERHNHIYTLTNLEHSHGSSATNLGLSVLRNQKIINSIAGKSIYPVPQQAVFQQFE
ncbi:monooxygenase [Oceanobacillus iheyensis HTE831]|uniref:L-lysine N6-monooxygenase MbtG n=1 Tax=Oceanobacillus iheyensis (strain DSM 14371 / CIP 107618 / JCM 11309 / KCTC 3954 / HTE831) TaxID=221109 RepID=Q8ET82_OCEIH|nr:lysine N(6)-hydroxylase/L-ornithine N(5)-oxygenase family protein [Oceanobacillus iheyensis]BAC12336.1 monooxygenase [Oceanobacillus iheyensis HTE831]